MTIISYFAHKVDYFEISLLSVQIWHENVRSSREHLSAIPIGEIAFLKRDDVDFQLHFSLCILRNCATYLN